MVIEAIKKRRSVRDYREKEIPENVLREIMEAGRLAPSARNQQAWKFIVIQDEAIKEKIMEACRNRSFVGQAPVVIAGCATNTSHIMPNGVSSYPVDLAIALDHISLQAADLGLGTCMIGWFNESKIRELLGVPKKRKIGLVITLGYAPEDYKVRKKIRKTLCSWRWIPT